jgi:hypothetical protein
MDPVHGMNASTCGQWNRLKAVAMSHGRDLGVRIKSSMGLCQHV